MKKILIGMLNLTSMVLAIIIGYKRRVTPMLLLMLVQAIINEPARKVYDLFFIETIFFTSAKIIKIILSNYIVCNKLLFILVSLFEFHIIIVSTCYYTYKVFKYKKNKRKITRLCIKN